MISVHITYTVKPEFVAQNKQNISTILADFKKMNDVSFFYNVYIKEDGITFLHSSMYDNEEAQQKVLSTPSFIAFQEQRDSQGLVGEPLVETLTLIGSSLSILT